MAEYIERAAAVKVVLRERKPTNSVAQNRMLSIIQRDLLTMRAAYEDTGLEPEQCENAKAIVESAFSDDTSNAARIWELLKADKGGRLVVTPCKVGDTVYEVTSRKTISEYRVKAIRVELFCTFIEWDIAAGFVDKSIFGVPVDEIGKTVFLTREEAEKALEEMKK